MDEAKIGRVNRKRVYAAIDSERDYQDKKWPGHRHSIDEYILYIEHHLAKARALSVTGDEDAALHEVRKVTSLGVVCMEENGAPMREV